jgi:hypothetical protein
MNAVPPRPSRRLNSRQGFAILITITLLSFLVILLVALATFTRVETQVAANSQNLAAARQNALMALNIAIGRLQETAGPDQRITATADVADSTNANAPTAPILNPHWTAVWNSTIPRPIQGQFPPLAYLVSGADDTYVKAGYTKASPNLDFNANSSDTSKTDVPISVSSDGRVLNPGTVRLVNTGSAFIDTANINNPKNGGVVVPTVPLLALVPGFSNPMPLGRYGFWIGDEGVKARLNLSTKNLSKTPPLQQIENFVVSSRNGIEVLRQSDGSFTNEAKTPPLSGKSQTFPSVDSPDYIKVLNREQLNLITIDESIKNNFKNALKANYHDVSTSSVGVLSNTRDGGLKNDLSSWLNNPPNTVGPLDNDFIFPNLGSATNPLTQPPKWSLIRSYNNIRATTTPVSPSQWTSTNHGIHPIVTYARLGMSPSRSTVTNAIRLNLFPVVTLWNPTNVTIAAANYEFGLFPRLSGASGLNTNFQYVVAGVNRQTSSYNFSAGYTRFRLNCPVMAPGQSIVFGATGNLAYSNTAAAVTTLSPKNLPFAETPTYVDLVAVGAPAVPANATIRWLVNGAGGANNLANLPARNYDFYLRLTPSNFTPPVFPATVVTMPDALQIVQQGIQGVQKIMPGPQTLQANAPLPQAQIPIILRFSDSTFINDGFRWNISNNARARFGIGSAVDYTAAGQLNQNYKVNCSTTGSPPGTVSLPSWIGSATSGFNLSSQAGTDAILFSFLNGPVAGRREEGTTTLQSLAQLQHVNLTALAFNPGYAVGNSYADYRLPTLNDITAASATTTAFMQGDATTINVIYDYSYNLNNQLWDKYFFSTLPQSFNESNYLNDEYFLPNQRYTFYKKPGENTQNAIIKLQPNAAYSNAAGSILINGSFNINSTSIAAWELILSGLNGLDYNPQTRSADGTSLTASFSRHPTPFGSFTPSSIDIWRGYRQLDSKQVRLLAEKIVDQVKLRGPFQSLADFVNRRPSMILDEKSLAGPLQIAIDNASKPGGEADTPKVNSPSGIFAANKANSGNSNFTSGTRLNRILGTTSGTTEIYPISSRAYGAPGTITQADILTQIGPFISARSDTFTIRTYGESLNGTTNKVSGKAWCEATVQRLPDFVDSKQPPETITSSLNEVNLKFGRRFRIVSLRWLNANEI